MKTRKTLTAHELISMKQRHQQAHREIYRVVFEKVSDVIRHRVKTIPLLEKTEIIVPKYIHGLPPFSWERAALYVKNKLVANGFRVSQKNGDDMSVLVVEWGAEKKPPPKPPQPPQPKTDSKPSTKPPARQSTTTNDLLQKLALSTQLLRNKNR
jgi:hypothetical protein